MKRLVPLLLLSLMACGGSTTLEIDIDIATNAGENPLLAIDADVKAGTSGGIYFVFESLRCPPGSIDDVSNFDRIEHPILTGGGISPTKEEFSINTSRLQPFTYYRVRMQDQNIAGQVTYTGLSDCPINISDPNAHRATICFGRNDPASLPFCPDTVPFTQCGVSNAVCVN